MPITNPGFEDAGTVQGLADTWTQSDSSDQRVATYGDAGQPAIAETPFESFRGGWDSNEDSKLAFEGLGTDLEAAIYDTGPGESAESNEDFGEGWGSTLTAFVSAANASYGGRAFVESTNVGPFSLNPGDILAATSSTGLGTSDPLTGTGSVITGAGATFPTGFTGQNAFRLTIDGGLPFVVELGETQLLADVINMINAAAGETVAADFGGSELEFASPTLGSLSRVHIEEIQVARATATNPGPYVLVDGQTILVEIDNGTTQTVTFNTADFGDIALATADEVAAVIAAQLTPGDAVGVFGIVSILSETTDGSRIEVVGGTAVAAFAFPLIAEPPLATMGHATTDTTGSGNVANLAAVTVGELAAIINATTSIQLANIEARVAGDALRIYDTIPETGTISVAAGAISTPLGLVASALATGIAAFTAEGFESEWLNNEDYLVAEGATAAGVFDVALDEFEDFEEEWKSNGTYHFDDTATAGSGAFYDLSPIVTTEQFEDFDPSRFDVEYSVVPSTDIFTSNGHLLITDTVVLKVYAVGGSLPSPLSEGVTYFPDVIDVNTFRLKETTGGPAIDITDNGSGTLYMKYSTAAFWTEEL